MKLQKYDPDLDIRLTKAIEEVLNTYVIDKINGIMKQADAMKISIYYIAIGQKQYDLMLQESIHEPVIFRRVSIRVSPHLDGIIAYPHEIGCNKEFIIG